MMPDTSAMMPDTSAMMPDTSSTDMPQNPDEARAEDDPQATQGRETHPPVDETHVGKKVFSPNELNQAGEDKEYFHPDGGRKFDAPRDANKHALKPDVEVTPDNTVKPVR